MTGASKKSLKQERHVYVAGPMRGLPDHNAPAFHAAEESLRWWNPNATIFNPARLHDGDMSLPLKDYLLPELTWLMESADTIAFLPGWKGSEGARIEYGIARAIGLDFVFLDAKYEVGVILSALEWDEYSPIEDEAWRLVHGGRNASYGPPSQDFQRTADMANGLFGTNLSHENVAQFMQLMKMSRQTHQRKRDNMIDKIGYALCEHRITEGY